MMRSPRISTTKLLYPNEDPRSVSMILSFPVLATFSAAFAKIVRAPQTALS